MIPSPDAAPSAGLLLPKEIAGGVTGNDWAWNDGWNNCLREVKKLNTRPAPHSDAVRRLVTAAKATIASMCMPVHKAYDIAGLWELREALAALQDEGKP